MLRKLRELQKNRKVRRATLVPAVLLPTAGLIASALGGWKETAGISFAVFTLLGLVSLLIDQVVELGERPELVYLDEPSALSKQIELLKSSRLNPSCVALIEYSTMSIQDLLRECRDARVQSLYLLMRDPSSALSDPQAGRIEDGIRQLCKMFPLHTLGSVRLRIKCYADPVAASLRGRLFGTSFVSVGWYTYDTRFGPSSGLDIVGGENPVLIARLTSPEGAQLKSMFEQVFVSLWNESRSIGQACADSPELAQRLPKAAAWLQAVSPGPDERCPLFLGSSSEDQDGLTSAPSPGPPGSAAGD